MKRTVLIIDDDADMREAVVEILGDAGFRALAAANGREALDLIAREGPPGLILLDLMMPVLDGWQFREAQRADPTIAAVPVVLMSAGVAPEGAGDQPGIVAVVQKPFEIDTLLNVVRTHAGGEPGHRERG